MSKISREALLEMAREAGALVYAVNAGRFSGPVVNEVIDVLFTPEKLECFAELCLAVSEQQQQIEDEPIPVAWQFYQNGEWRNGSNDIKDHRKNTENAGIPIRDLFAHPPAEDNREAIRRIFMSHGFTVNEGHNDLKPYVYEAAEALLSELLPSAAIPAGSTTVPIEPTDEMVVRGAEAMSDSFRCLGIDTDEDPRWGEIKCDIAQSIFSAMIDFAPPQPRLVSADDIVTAEREACAELLASQHTWLTNVAAARLILSRSKK